VSRVALCREFERLGLAFPYLAERTETTATTTSDTSSGGRQEEKVEVEEEWQRKKLAAIDMEHSLCYFCRLLRSRKAFAERGTPVRTRLTITHLICLPLNQLATAMIAAGLLVSNQQRETTAREERSVLTNGCLRLGSLLNSGRITVVIVLSSL
jgi:hypothetical protein